MKISDISIFKNLSTKSKTIIDDAAEFIFFKIGQPVIFKDIIPDKIYIIIEGEARLIITKDNEKNTIAKLGQGTILGLAPILCAKGFEEIVASTNVKSIAIPDKIIVNLYNEEDKFRDYCNSTKFPSEIAEITQFLIKRSNRTDIDLSRAFKLCMQNSKVEIVKNDSRLNTEQNFKKIILSSNFESKNFGDLVNNNIQLKCRGPFNGRIVNLREELFNEFSNKNLDLESRPNDNLSELKDRNFDQSKSGPEKSSLNFGQYAQKKEIKIIRAVEEKRVAIACLQMLATELNLPFRKDSVEKTIREETRGGKKPSLEICGNITSTLGLYSSYAKLPREVSTRLPVPSIISYKNNLAVLIETNSEGIKIASPTDGLVDLNRDEIKRELSEFIEVLIVERSSLTPNKKFGVDWFLPSLKKYKGVLTQVLLASFVVQFFGLANPLLIQVIIDKVISQRSLDTLQVLGIALVFVTILGGVIGSLRTFLFTETTNRIDTRLGAEVIDHLLRLPLNYFDKRPVGELGTRVAELEKIRNFLTGQALTTILDAAFSVIYIVVMVIYSWLLTLIALGVLPIQIALTLIGSPLLRRQIRESAKQNAKTQSHLVEVLTGVQTVKAQNVETVSRWKWQKLYGKYIARTFEKTITVTALQQTSQVLQQLSQLLVLWVGASLVLNGQLTLGQLIAFRIISSYVTQPLLRLSSIWQSIQELKVSFERLADIIDSPEESNESDKANIPLPSIKGNVEFRDVSFSFKKQGPNILKNISLSIPEGKFIGIAGQSGSGKSTLMKLLPRLYSIEKGKIIIDGYDVSKVELYSLRKQIGIVPQDPLLFAGSVSENIALTDPEVAADKIVNAAKIAAAHDFIMDLPLGYSSDVGERGSGLSGGQRQRIAIARTLLNQPKLLIMDEATSALDYETESKVCENLRTTCKGTTVFFITHRLSTIKNADMILMMHDGSVAETGTHSELMEKKGRYFALYKQQESS